MTWWEVETLAHSVNGLERRLEEWALSNPKMRIEQEKVTKLAEKIDQALPTAAEADKKDFLVHLAGRVEELREHLTERLKREVTRNVSPRNLLS